MWRCCCCQASSAAATDSKPVHKRYEFGIPNQQVHSWLKHLAGALKAKFHPQQMKCCRPCCQPSSPDLQHFAGLPQQQGHPLPSHLATKIVIQTSAYQSGCANKECKDRGQSYFDFRAIGKMVQSTGVYISPFKQAGGGVVLPSTWKPDSPCSQKHSHHHYLQRPSRRIFIS